MQGSIHLGFTAERIFESFDAIRTISLRSETKSESSSINRLYGYTIFVQGVVAVSFRGIESDKYSRL